MSPTKELRCFYCDKRMLYGYQYQRDHFPIPRRRGGKDTVIACVRCHWLKDRICSRNGWFHKLERSLSRWLTTSSHKRLWQKLMAVIAKEEPKASYKSFCRAKKQLPVFARLLVARAIAQGDMRITAVSTGAKEAWLHPKYRAKMSEKWQDPKYRAKLSAAVSASIKKKWQDPKHRTKMRRLYRDSAPRRAKIAAGMRRAWRRPEYREKISAAVSAAIKKGWQDPEYRATMSASSKKLWRRPEHRAKTIASMRRVAKMRAAKKS